MSNERVISYADLRAIESALSAIATLASRIDDHVDSLQSQQVFMLNRLEALIGEFTEFVRTDARHKELHLAETRIVKVRQEIDTRFGHYAEVRRTATGVLQALDVDVVGVDTVRTATEELMITAKGYWLAPALVALAAWARDERPLAERALAEALRRDDYKTSLFFTLTARRLSRPDAARRWLGRFFAHQNPTALDREFVVLLDAVATGVFGPEARALTASQIGRWLEELGERAGFVAEQEQRWANALSALAPTVGADEYPALRTYSPAWPHLEGTLSGARLHARVIAHFQGIFTGRIVASPRVVSEIDALLDSLVTHFDDEELPLRGQERLLQLVIDEGGDRTTAQTRFAAEQESFEEKTSFTALLTSAAMHPEQSHASAATQRFAIALSRDWIVAAHDAVTARARGEIPTEIAVKTGAWIGKTQDGANEKELLSAQAAHYRQLELDAMDAVKLAPAATIAVAVGALLALLGIVNVQIILLILGGAGIGYFFLERKATERRRQTAGEQVRDAHRKAANVLRAALAEVVDFRTEVAREDARAEEFREMMLELSPEQYALTHESAARAVIA